MSNSKVVIFGVGGLGRELWGWVRNGANVRLRTQIAGFVVDGDKPVNCYDGLPVIDRDQADRDGAPGYLLAVAEPSARRRLVGELAARGWHACSYVHESTLLGVHLSIGAGTLVFPRCSISSDATLGEHVLVNGGTAIGHDCMIGAFSSILGGASINGNVVLGEGVLVGAGAIIHPGRRIGNGGVVGMGSVVFRNVAAGQTVYGNPAKPME